MNYFDLSFVSAADLLGYPFGFSSLDFGTVVDGHHFCLLNSRLNQGFENKHQYVIIGSYDFLVIEDSDELSSSYSQAIELCPTHRPGDLYLLHLA